MTCTAFFDYTEITPAVVSFESQCHMQLCWVCTLADISEDDLE